jgi:hypothetical protein
LEPTEARVGQRHQWDDIGAGLSREPQGDVVEVLEDLHFWFVWVLEGVSKGVWAHIQDDGVLDQCVGVPTEWRALICRAVVAGASLTGQLPPGAGVIPIGGVPPTDRGPRGGSLVEP